MRKLSYWAKYHPVQSRILIALSHVLLAGTAVWFAWQLFLRGIQVQSGWLYVFLLLFIIAAVFYPRYKPGIKKTIRQYWRQKTCDLVVAICGFAMVGIYSNQVFFNNTPGIQQVMASINPVEPGYKNAEAKKIIDTYYNGEKSEFSKKEKRILKDEFGYQLKTYAKAVLGGEKQKADATATIILAILGAGLLLYLVAALACTISCNGSDVGAVIVLLLGTAAIIFGLVAVIKAAKRRARKKNEEQVAPDKSI